MSAAESDETLSKGLAQVLGENSEIAKVFYSLPDAPWVPVKVSKNGEGAGQFPDNIRDEVDLEEYFDGAEEIKYIEGERFNLLAIKVIPNFTIPRHSHNLDQAVLVMEGSLLRGKRRFGAGEGYFTPADQVYTVTAGPEGVTYLEIRGEPLSQIRTTWVETNPARWVR